MSGKPPILPILALKPWTEIGYSESAQNSASDVKIWANSEILDFLLFLVKIEKIGKNMIKMTHFDENSWNIDFFQWAVSHTSDFVLHFFILSYAEWILFYEKPSSSHLVALESAETGVFPDTKSVFSDYFVREK